MALCLISCSSFPVLDLTPAWVRETPRIAGSVVFVGKGEGEEEGEARSAALEDALSQMGDSLGYDLASQYLREFIGTARIRAFGTYVSETYATEHDGVYSCMVLAVTPEAGFYSQRSEAYTAMVDRQEEIKALLEEAKAHYRENEDGEALSDALLAVSLSLDGPVIEDRYKPEALLEIAKGYLAPVRLRQIRKMNTVRLQVRVTRDKGWFSPRVVNAVVDALFPVTDNTTGIAWSRLECKTDRKGQFVFENTNPYRLREGAVTFRLHVPDGLLDEIEAKAGEDFLKDFLRRYEASGLTCKYSEGSARDPKDLVIAVSAESSEGEGDLQSVAFTSFSRMLGNTGVTFYEVVSAEGEESEIYESLKAAYPDRRYFLMVRFSITDYREALGAVYVRSDGVAALMDSRTDSLVFSRESFAAASGSDMESAVSSSLALEAAIAAGGLLAEL